VARDVKRQETADKKAHDKCQRALWISESEFGQLTIEIAGGRIGKLKGFTNVFQCLPFSVGDALAVIGRLQQVCRFIFGYLAFATTCGVGLGQFQ